MINGEHGKYSGRFLPIIRLLREQRAWDYFHNHTINCPSKTVTASPAIQTLSAKSMVVIVPFLKNIVKLSILFCSVLSPSIFCQKVWTPPVTGSSWCLPQARNTYGENQLPHCWKQRWWLPTFYSSVWIYQCSKIKLCKGDKFKHL